MIAAKPVDPATLKALISEQNTLVIDVRSETEIGKTGTIKGACCIPAIEVPRRARRGGDDYDPRFATAKTIVVFCAIGARSAAVAETLVNMGYPDVRDFGRLSHWTDAGFPTEAPPQRS